MIKPEAVAAGHAGKIIDMIISNGYRIIALKYTRLSQRRGRCLL
jgi:nucleoside-diphosphate kinase